MYEGNSPVGFASFSEIEKTIWKLHKIYILPQWQGKGLGNIFIDFIINSITLKGAKALQLNVNRNNPAKYFYEKLKFNILRQEDIDIGNRYFMNDFIMEKVSINKNQLLYMPPGISFLVLCD